MHSGGGTREIVHIHVRLLGIASLLWTICSLAACTMSTDNANSGSVQLAATATLDISPVSSASGAQVTAAPPERPPSATQTIAAAPSESPIAEAAETIEPALRESGNSEAQLATHTVRSGDTLTRIAEFYDVSINALLNANELPNPDYLEVGQVINLPESPSEYTASFRILPDSRLVRSIGAFRFDSEDFLRTQAGALRSLSLISPTRLADGSLREDRLSGGQLVDRVAREYSVDARLLLAFLEHFAGLVTDAEVAEETQLYPLLAPEPARGIGLAGLYNQLSWLADHLNQGYYDWKYRGKTILESPDGSRRYYHPDLNAASIAAQFVIAQLRDVDQWELDVGEGGLYATYRRLFGDPFAGALQVMPADLLQPALTLPFPRGDVWRFTGGFHGGWGKGSAWSAVDFAPPDEETGWCYTSAFPVTAIASGIVARMGDGLIVLDLDEDGDEGSGWTILYLHINPHDALREGQTVEAGNILGYTSCAGGYSTATHLHIARRYNGEWIPADCNRCPAGTVVPPFVMSNWKVVGLGNQLYQGFLVNMVDNRNVIAEQGRFTNVNAISW